MSTSLTLSRCGTQNDVLELGTWQKQLGEARHETPLTQHHNWNIAVETPENVTHENAECGNRDAPVGDPCGVASHLRPNGTGCGNIPDAIKVRLTWRLVAGTWLLIRFGKCRNLRLNLKLESQFDVRNQGRNVEHNPDANMVWDTD